jgi:hypothetical protein
MKPAAFLIAALGLIDSAVAFNTQLNVEFSIGPKLVYEGYARFPTEGVGPIWPRMAAT